MKKISMKPGTMLCPVPTVLVSCGTMEKSNVITIAWTGIVNSDPAMTYISVRPERYSHGLIEETGEFVINCVNRNLTFAADLCGCVSGSKEDKFKKCKLTKAQADIVSCPMIAESPINLECRVVEKKSLGSHDMYLAEIVAVHVDESLMQSNGRLAIENAELVAYAHSCYLPVGKKSIGRMGFSVMKPKTKKKLDGRRRSAQRSAKRKK